MAKSARQYEMNMTEGPLLGKILRFSLPLAVTGILQLLYNAADVVVVGQFVGSQALAAVSSTGSLVNLIVSVFSGLSLGTSVAVAQGYGAGKKEDASRAVHTSIAVALIGGLAVALLGLFLSRPMLVLMDSPEDVLDLSALYLKIYFLGAPFNMLYNFGSAVLRAIGDTKRPLYFLTVSGLINVALNLFLVVVCGMGVAGVAIATVTSQVVSCVLVLFCLIRSNGFIRLRPREIRIYKDKLLEIIKIGLPAGIQGSIFSISNVIIQSSINGFGSAAMAGNGASSNLEGFISISMDAIYQAALTFISQNVGARKPHRISKIMWCCLGVVSAVGIVMSGVYYLFQAPLLRIYNTEETVVQMGQIRMSVMLPLYFVMGIMNVFVGGLRGFGNSFVPMMVSILGVCVFRMVWIYTVFPLEHTLTVLYLSYPISWFLTATIHCICYLAVKKRFVRRMLAEGAAAE